MNPRRFPRRRSALCAALCLAFAASPAGAMEVKKFAIGDFTDECGGSERSSWPNMVDGWYDEMSDHGHSRDGNYVNGDMTLRRFCDPDWDAACRDDSYVDDADAFVIATHGADSGDHWQSLMRWSWNGHCRLDAGGTADEMWVGDIDAEFGILSSCHSGDDDNMPGLRRAMVDPGDSAVNGRRAHQLQVFHGLMYISNGRRDDYEDFADDAHSESMSDAWVYNQIDSKQCPVAYATSSSLNGCLTRLNYERYNYVYGDPPGNSYYCWKAFLECDPDDETAWNPP